MTRHYLDILADVIRENWDKPALTDYATLDGGPGNNYTYGQMYEQILALCDRFRQVGLKHGDHIAICGSNSANWVVAYLAIAKFQGISVTILHTQMPDEIVKLIDFSDAKSLFVDKSIWSEIEKRSLNSVKSVFILDDFSTNFESVEDINATGDVNFYLTESNITTNLSQICFTSGTTGKPKGVMLTALNISANVVFLMRSFAECPMINSVSFLPMSHAGVFVSDILHLLCRGANIHIISDLTSPSELMSAYAEIKPQVVVMVPMMIDKLIASMQPISDWELLHNKINAIFGNALEMFCLGGAMCSIETEDILLKAKFPFALGYGTTECSPFISLMMPSFVRKGAVGKVCSTLECRIASNSEILVRGDNVMLGYYKDPEATAAKIDKDGWLHTGDRGHLDEDGYLYVEGRLEQDMIVLPSGENISPAKVESIINACEGVEESIVIARDGKLMALVVPNHVLPSPLGEGQGVRLRNELLAQINPQLPAYSQLFGIEFLSTPLARTEKKTIKRYLYK